jgi:serine/threonine protein phosphatase PrpC
MGLLGFSVAGILGRGIADQPGEPLGNGEFWQAAGMTDRGRVRRANEDAIASCAEAGVFVVCDGMGGAAGGAVASRLAAETVISALNGEDANPSLLDGTTMLRSAIRQANAAVFARAQADKSLHGMGTTLVSLLLQREMRDGSLEPPLPTRCGKAYVAHVGDSRCYRMRDGCLEQLTQDHAWVAEQVRLGRLTPAQARRSPMANVITRAVGTRPEVQPDLLEIPAAAGDLFLLATDGLTREVPESSIAGILAQAAAGKLRLEQACGGLVAAANARGGRDNISCVLVRVS